MAGMLLENYGIGANNQPIQNTYAPPPAGQTPMTTGQILGAVGSALGGVSGGGLTTVKPINPAPTGGGGMLAGSVAAPTGAAPTGKVTTVKTVANQPAAAPVARPISLNNPAATVRDLAAVQPGMSWRHLAMLAQAAQQFRASQLSPAQAAQEAALETMSQPQTQAIQATQDALAKIYSAGAVPGLGMYERMNQPQQ